MPSILGLDASSTMIGYCLLEGEQVTAHGEIKLRGDDIADRCRQAQNALIHLIDGRAIDAVAIEAPVVRRFLGKGGRRVDTANAVIPQARVSGALLAMVSLRELAWIEIEPATAKRAATTKGNANKDAVQQAAIAYGVLGEHAADAWAVARAAVPRVRVGEG